MYRPLESRFSERTSRQRFEMLHERGSIEIMEAQEDAESVTFVFRRIPPPPSLGGWHYAASYYGDYAADTADAARHNCVFVGVQAFVRRVERGEFVEYDVFTSASPETEVEIPPHDLIDPDGTIVRIYEGDREE